MNNNPPIFSQTPPSTPVFVSPTPQSPQKDKKKLLLIGGGVLFLLFIILGMIFFPPKGLNNSPADSSNQVADPTPEDNADQNSDDISEDYGVDELAAYRPYINLNFQEDLPDTLDGSSFSLLIQTLSDYFAFAYPTYSEIDLKTDSFPFLLTLKGSNLPDKSFQVSLAPSLVEISSAKNQLLLSYKPILNLEETPPETDEFDSLFGEDFVDDISDDETLDNDVFNYEGEDF